MASWSTVSAAAGALVTLSLLLVLLGDAEARTLITLPVVALVLLGLQHQGRWPRWGRASFAGYLVLSAVGFSVDTWRQVARNLSALPEWDYFGFWLHARSAVLGLNFYDPASAQALTASIRVSPEFQQEIVDVGFWYPPPSMFLFWPLGWTDALSALPPWYAFHLLALALVVLLLWRLFFPGGGLVELLGCLALVGTADGTYTTFYFAQTNFVALLAVLLFWRRPGAWSGGAWLAAAVFVKPFLAALAVEPLLGRRWRVVAALALCAAALLAASALAFGADTFLAYFDGHRLDARPAWIYVEPTNQSLLGLVLRATRAVCDGVDCVTNPTFLGLAALLGALTLALGIGLQRRGEPEWARSLYLLLALIVYPVSQLFYSVMLIPPLLAAWRQRERFAGGAWSVSIVAAAVYALAALTFGGATVFAYGLLWTAMALAGLRLVQGRGWPLRAAHASGDDGRS
jgi:hypothetical protein